MPSPPEQNAHNLSVRPSLLQTIEFFLILGIFNVDHAHQEVEVGATPSTPERNHHGLLVRSSPLKTIEFFFIFKHG